MTFNELNGMTVLQLRKLAREHSVVLGAGIDKAGIIEKLLSVLSESEPPVREDTGADRHSDTPKYSARPAYQAPGSAPRPAWLNTTPSGQ